MKDLRPLGHPLHPPTTHVPLGLLLTLPLWDVLGWFTGNPAWWAVSFWTLAAGLAAGGLAAMTGLLDYLKMDNKNPAAKAALWHLSLMGTALALETLNLLLRGGPGLPKAPLLAATGVSLGGALLLGIGGWWGGELVYKHRVGIAP